MEDWATLFRMLEAGDIKPVIMNKFPILQAAQANALLESGQVFGNIVLCSPQVL
jgi:NADPH:quinone reductase-like Zn-dependent oxidoreductase